MTKTFPYDGMGLNSFPSVERVVKVTLGADSDAADVHMITTGTYDVLAVKAGTLVSKVATRVRTAFTGSYTITIGDSDDVDGFLVDTDIIPGTSSVAGDPLRSALTDTGVNVTTAYASGKYYAADQTIQAVGGGAAAAAGLMDVFFWCSTAGLEDD